MHRQIDRSTHRDNNNKIYTCDENIYEVSLTLNHLNYTVISVSLDISFHLNFAIGAGRSLFLLIEIVTVTVIHQLQPVGNSVGVRGSLRGWGDFTYF